jgi:hypothetical protein
MYEIKKDSINHYILKLTNNNYSKIIGNSIIKILDNSYYDKDTHSIHLIYENVITFSDYLKNNNYKLTEQKCIQLIDNLYKHFSYIIKGGYGLYGIDLQDIILVDDLFVFVSSNNILSLHNSKINNNALFMTLYEPLLIKPYFSSPEIINISIIPATIRIECFYYSLASLVIYCLTNKYIFEGNDIKSVEEIKKIIQLIKFGKLYWFLERCLHPNPEERKCFLI